MSDLISVIIPVYNTEIYLEKCLLSVQNQIYDNLEIIVIDDGSTDKSPEICDAFAEKDGRFKVIHQKNAGQAKARNVGLREATGRYIGFVDSDDYIEPEMFEEMYHAAKRSGAYIIMCGYRKFGMESGEYLAAFDELERDEAVKALAEDRMIRSYLWDKLFWRALFEGIEFPVGKQYEDISVMHLLFMETNKVKMVNRVLYCYQSRSDSTTSTTKGSKSRDFMEALEKRCDDLRNTPFYESARNTQMKAVRNVLFEMMAEGEKRSSYYRELRIKMKKVLAVESASLDKKEVLKTKTALWGPSLFFGIRLIRRRFRKESEKI